MEKAYEEILTSIGEDLNRPGLKDTPKRAAKAFKFLNNGYEKNLDDVINGALFPSDNEEMVIVKDIELYSLCEHHLLPFIGKCHVAYLPSGKVLGLSKVARIVDMFARRLQIQENMTKQIADTIMQVTDAKGVHDDAWCTEAKCEYENVCTTGQAARRCANSGRIFDVN